jgi:hypothetical protein
MAVYTTIDDPSAYFKVQLYTGNGSANHAITFNDTDTDMQPDMVWIKNRDATDNNIIFDSVRGATKRLYVDTTAVEATDADTLDSFTSDGFQLDADVKVNTNAEKYVAWCWKESTTSGLDIVSNVKNDNDVENVSHNLSAVPEWIMGKSIDVVASWICYNKASGNTHAMYLHADSVPTDSVTFFNDTTPTTSVFTVGADNGWAGTNIFYAFTPKQGFSKFGTYEGNGNADGTFVWCGFKPAFVMTKSIDSTSSWHIFDNKREGYNVDNDPLVAHDTTVEATTDMIDILSNGFKLRIATDPNVAETYLYIAFAEAPFVNSNGVPCNAR